MTREFQPGDLVQLPHGTWYRVLELYPAANAIKGARGPHGQFTTNFSCTDVVARVRNPPPRKVSR